MLVLKRHTTEPTEKEMTHMREVASDYCGAHDIQVILDHVPNHWHGHLINYETHPSEAN